MTRYLWLVVALLVWVASVTLNAAYTTATIISNDPQPDGTVLLEVQFSGLGEQTVTRRTTIGGTTTVLQLRRWAIQQRDELNNAQPLGKLAGLQKGQVVDLTTIPGPTQAEIDRLAWLERAKRLARLRQLEIPAGNALDTAIDALEAQVISTFSAAYITDF